ncbi:MAG: hypothetical protein N2203_00230, partial [Bacteroidia bacterium]|nr:hypothetical protein [Bacteroidia bacterium]
MKQWIKIFVFLIFGLLQLAKAQFYYGSIMEFGKNRVQYQPFEWTYFDADKYKVYTYQGGQDIAKYVYAQLPQIINTLEKRLDYQIEDKLSVIVYNNIHDFYQSNIGLQYDEINNVAGYTKIIGDKIFVYFDGNLEKLKHDLRYSITEWMINKYMYSGSAKDAIKSNAIFTMPDWYIKGLAKFMAEGWTVKNDLELLELMRTNTISDIKTMEGKAALIAGHALWYYIADIYSEASIPNIIYLTKINHNPDDAFIFILGNSVNDVFFEMLDAYNKHYFKTKDNTRNGHDSSNVITVKHKKRETVSKLIINNDETHLAFITEYLGQKKLFAYDIQNKKKKRILKLYPKLERETDKYYPLIAWHPKNNILLSVYELKNVLYLHTFDLQNKEEFKKPITGFEKIMSISYSNDGKKLVMSAVKQGKGQSDIFVYTINNGGVEQITDDIYDDDEPIFINNNKAIIFSSNRTSDTLTRAYNDNKKFFRLYQSFKDIFYTNYPQKNNLLIRVSNTPNINEYKPIPSTQKSNEFYYLSDENGFVNLFHAQPDSAILTADTTVVYQYFYHSKPVSNVNYFIRDAQLVKDNFYFTILFNSKTSKYFKENMALMKSPLQNHINERKLKPTWMRSYARNSLINPGVKEKNLSSVSEKLDNKNTPITPPKKGIDFENYSFDNELSKNNSHSSDTIKKQNISTQPITKPVLPANYSFPIQQNYYTTFYADHVLTQFNNSFLFPTYQRFTGGTTPVYLNPGFNFITKIGLNDLFENQNIIAGFRIGGTLDNEFLLAYEYRKKLYDHQVLLHRQTFVKINNFYGNVAKVISYNGRYTLKYPLNEVLSLRTSLQYRNDQAIYLALTDDALPRPNETERYGGSKIELVYDDSRYRDINLFEGWRGKAWIEYMQKIENTSHYLLTYGFDFRNYWRIHKYLYWCNRWAYGGSAGTDKLIYYLGGVDNWLTPRFNTNINVIHSDEYQFQTLATNMRGFTQNIRNGNNFTVFNSELRSPFVRYLFKDIKSEFWRTFQGIVFADIGAAWYGWNPVSEENTVNKSVYNFTSFIITVYEYKNPLVGGFG